MKLVSFLAGGEARLGVLSDGRIFDGAAAGRLWQREQGGRADEAPIPSDALAFARMGPSGLDILGQAVRYVSGLELSGAESWLGRHLTPVAVVLGS